MCGRFTIAESATSIADSLDALPPAASAHKARTPSYNTSPGQPILALDSTSNKRRIRTFHWGFRTHSGGFIINARLETLAEKHMFRPLIDGHRCLIPVSGWYEWERTPEAKHPWYHTIKGSPIILLAALWRSETSIKDTTVILTRPSLPAINHIHHRMPVIIPLHKADQWLANEPFSEPPQYLADADLSAIPVSPAVNSVKNNTPDSIRPAPPPLKQPSLFD